MPQRILVTAGASGIGRAIVERFIEAGAEAAICDVDAEALEVMRKEYPGLKAGQADVSDEARMEAFLSELEADWGGVDVACANAGTGGPAGPVEEIDYGEWRSCVAVNLHGAFLTCRWAARLMKAQRSGLIVLTSSTAGQMGYPFRSPYASAKWAVVGLAKTLAMELGPFGVRVNAVCPGAIEGPRMNRVIAKEARARGLSEEEVRTRYAKGTSMRTWVSAEEIAGLVSFLASPSGARISGQVLAVDGHTETLSP